MNSSTLEDVIQTYGVENWGAGYFEINHKGHMVVRPARGDARALDVKELVDHLVDERRLQVPILLRFPQILTNQLHKLHSAFETAAREFQYQGDHFPVFPMKVNPRREVVEEFLREATKCDLGLECGSKAELYAALSMEQPASSLLICNGFKDEAFVHLALLGTQVGKRVVLVVEKLNELKMIIRLAQESGVQPWIGLRAKLYSKGTGKWASSGGEAAKFGLTTSEILECIRLLREHQMAGSLKLLHFHIGSQITDIKRVKNAMKEAARVYAKIRQTGINVEYLDIGGGMGVDYDGSKTTFEASINYTMQEFANDAVYTIKSVCADESVPEPHLVTESGRVMTAYHAVFITSIRDEIETFADDRPEITVDDDDPQIIVELKAVCDGINAKNYREYYHDALDDKDELHTQFSLGLISLEDRAKGEVLFWEVCARVSRLARAAKVQEEEFDELKKILASKYLCNFSVFRSTPDSWAIGQLFPIMPIHRLDKRPTDYATLVDVTCDSDGQIDKFVDLKDTKDVLELHPFTGEPYYLAIFLVGAYQEVMGSNHNLFGQPNEAHVVIDEGGQFHITRIVPGSRIGDMLQFARYDKSQVAESFRHIVERRVDAGLLDAATAEEVLSRYSSDLQRYTYLERERMSDQPHATSFGAQPYEGIATFARQRHSRDLAGVDVAVLGVPYDGATSYRSGARFGPRAIREQSLLLWGYNNALSVAPFEKLSTIDYGDVPVVPVDILATHRAIEEHAGTILASGAKLLSLGGDHSIALPLLRAHSRRHGPLAVIHFDSHPDTWDVEFSGQKHSHGTPFRRAIEEECIDSGAYLQIGIRGPTAGPQDYQDALRLGARMITLDEALEVGIAEVVREVRERVADRPVYLSFDIDAVDPAFAPGTGTPEVGGFTSHQILQILRGLKGLDFIGFDLVEVAPSFDHGAITSILAANLAFEFLSLLAIGKRR